MRCLVQYRSRRLREFVDSGVPWQQRQATRTDLDPRADAPEITFQGWCRNNGASGRDRRDFRACPGAFRRVRPDRRQKKGDDLVSDSDRGPDLSSDILKRLRDSLQHRGVANSIID